MDQYFTYFLNFSINVINPERKYCFTCPLPCKRNAVPEA